MRVFDEIVGGARDVLGKGLDICVGLAFDGQFAVFVRDVA
jgi:hypothetical protein